MVQITVCSPLPAAFYSWVYNAPVVNMQHDALSEANEQYECTCMDTQFMLNSGIVLFV